jgi:hypothetical protein
MSWVEAKEGTRTALRLDLHLRMQLRQLARHLSQATSRKYVSMAGRSVASIPRDVQEFLQDYPSQDDDPRQNANLHFYQNTLRCRPDGLLIDELHEKLVELVFL